MMGKALAIAGIGLEDLPGNSQPGTLGWLKLKAAVWETVETYIQRGFDTFYADVKTGADLLCWETLTDIRDSGRTPIRLFAVRSYKDRSCFLLWLSRMGVWGKPLFGLQRAVSPTSFFYYGENGVSVAALAAEGGSVYNRKRQSDRRRKRYEQEKADPDRRRRDRHP